MGRASFVIKFLLKNKAIRSFDFTAFCFLKRREETRI